MTCCSLPRRIVIVLGTLLLSTFVCFAGDTPTTQPLHLPKIDRRPQPSSWTPQPIDKLPHFDPANPSAFTVDLRHRDLSKLDLSNSVDDLHASSFDNATRWPDPSKLPTGFDPAKIIEFNKNPGLGIRALHARGITGKGVGIGIIDLTLLTDHQELKDRLRFYEECRILPFSESEMHGPCVASIAVGKDIGVAPEADLYFIASMFGEFVMPQHEFKYDLKILAQNIRRLLEVNRQLPAEHKIRAISISLGINPALPGYDQCLAAMKEADQQNVLLVHCGSNVVYGHDLNGLGRAPDADPNDFKSYTPGRMYRDVMIQRNVFARGISVPMDTRTLAGFCATDEYAHYSLGGASWTAPYFAASYALACQVDPTITPAQFWDLAIKTGRTIRVRHNGAELPFGPILDPAALLDSLKRN